MQSRKKRSAALLKLVEVSAPRLEKEPKVKAPPVVNTIAARTRAHGARWWVKLQGDMQDIDALRPQRGCVICDNSNGRYLIAHRSIPGVRVSISWTKRGKPHAVRMVLRQLWEWETDLTGQPNPLPAKMLAA